MHEEPDELPDREAALAAAQAEIRSCRRCVTAGFIPAEYANPVLLGNVRQRVMIVGQAPSASGHLQSRPWAGPAGRVLRSWMAGAGIDEEAFYASFYLTSLTKCFPGRSRSGNGDRSASAAEIALCAGHLDREIALVRPAVVVTLGGMAAKVFLGAAPLDRIVGTVAQVERAGRSFAVVPLPHPSGVSRWLNDPANRARTAAGIALLRQLMTSDAESDLESGA